MKPPVHTRTHDFSGDGGSVQGQDAPLHLGLVPWGDGGVPEEGRPPAPREGAANRGRGHRRGGEEV